MNGGIIGIILGMAFSQMVSLAAQNALKSNLFQAHFSWYLIVGAMLFSIIVGCVSGLGADGIDGLDDDGGFGRIFSVAIEGEEVLTRFKVAVAASAQPGVGQGLAGGEPFIAIQRSFIVAVDDWN